MKSWPNSRWYDPFRFDYGCWLTANRGGSVRYWNPDR